MLKWLFHHSSSGSSAAFLHPMVWVSTHHPAFGAVGFDASILLPLSSITQVFPHWWEATPWRFPSANRRTASGGCPVSAASLTPCCFS